MGLCGPWADSLEIILFADSKKLREINPMGLSTPRFDSIEIFVLHAVKKCLTQWALVNLGLTLNHH